MTYAAQRRRPYAYVAAGLAAAIGVGVLSVLVPATAAVATPLVGVESGKCLDVVGTTVTAGASMVIAECDGTSEQVWELTADNELRTQGGGLCLDVAYASTAVGAGVIVWPCHSGANQSWSVNADGTIVGTQSALCLDVANRAVADGSPVLMWSCNGGGNQGWTSTPAPVPSGDTAAPSVPGNPRISDLTCTTVAFSWSAATDDVAVAFYDVYHDGQQVATVAGTTLGTALTVVPGLEWGWYVNARDVAGNVSQASETVYVKPPVCSVDSVPPPRPRAYEQPLPAPQSR